METHQVPSNPYNAAAQAVRFSRCEENLKDAGGKRINVRLQPKAAKALAKMMRRGNINATTAVNNAILGAQQ